MSPTIRTCVAACEVVQSIAEIGQPVQPPILERELVYGVMKVLQDVDEELGGLLREVPLIGSGDVVRAPDPA